MDRGGAPGGGAGVGGAVAKVVVVVDGAVGAARGSDGVALDVDEEDGGAVADVGDADVVVVAGADVVVDVGAGRDGGVVVAADEVGQVGVGEVVVWWRWDVVHAAGKSRRDRGAGESGA